MYKVLIVESDSGNQQLIAQSLIFFDLKFTTTIVDAFLAIKTSAFDGFVVDMTFSEHDRLLFLNEVLQSEKFQNIPVLCMGESQNVTDRVNAFNMGCDDFLVKPFDLLEFRARVENKIRKSIKLKNKAQMTAVGNIFIDHTSHRVLVRDGQLDFEVSVTQTEFKLLTCLARNPEQVYSREQLLASAWGDQSGVLERVVDVHICLLRKKLGDKCSHTVKALSGVGYKLTINRKLSLGA